MSSDLHPRALTIRLTSAFHHIYDISSISGIFYLCAYIVAAALLQFVRPQKTKDLNQSTVESVYRNKDCLPKYKKVNAFV